MRTRFAPADPSALPSEIIENLEHRRLMAAFASVGLSFDRPVGTNINAAVYAVEGDVASNNTVTGDMYFAGVNQRNLDSGLPYSRINKLADGRFQRDPKAGRRGEPVEVNGAQFLAADRYAAGWWMGEYAPNSAEVEFTVERAVNSTLNDLAGSWRFSIIALNNDTDRLFSGSGVLTITGSRVDWSVDRGSIPYTRSDISQTAPDGRIITQQLEYFYLSADKKVLLLSDMNRADGIAYAGVAVRLDTTVTAAQLSGAGFLTNYLWSQNNGQPANVATTRQLYLDLESDGDYKLYDLDEWDDGRRDSPLERGFWSVSSGFLILDQQDSADETRFAITSSGAVLLPLSEGATRPDAITGVATRSSVLIPGPTSPQQYLSIGATDPFGRPSVYELGTDNIWRVTDLIARAGGPTLLSEPLAWVDLKDNRQYAAGVSSQGLILYTMTQSGTWSFRNLTTEIAGAQSIANAIQIMAGPDRNWSITGLDAQGRLLRYFQTGQTVNNALQWGFVNITTNDLIPNGQTTPAFTGQLTSYATRWGALNVVGLDASGNVWTVWWTPGLSAWRADNLTATIGATPLAGSLNIFQTSWDAINIVGLDNQGRVQATWWVPGFSEWRRDSITDAVAGGTSTRFRAGSLGSFVTSWGATNVVGIDDASGKTRALWWAPGLSQWADSSISDAVPAGSPAQTRGIRGLAGTDNSLNILGYASDNSLIRYYWYPNGTWLSQNLSTISTPR